MKEFLKLSKQDKLNVFNQTSERTGLPSAAIEKDWWVTLSLRAIFSLPFSEHIVFKGGTSLSKAWNLIERFSEDIDLAINRTYLGFEGDISKTQIKKLRKASCSFISGDFNNVLDNELTKMNISGFELVVQQINDTDTDPLVIELRYDSITEDSEYLKSRILIEIGARSLMEPTEVKPIQTLVGQEFNDLPFADKIIMLPIVLPKRTFLEKVFLLHEEFQKSHEYIRIKRMSRHLYDLEKLMDTEHGTSALRDVEMYETIVKHRKKFNTVRGIDYSNHSTDRINIVPPDNTLKDWQKDYKAMQESMIYGDSLNFDQLMERITELNHRINAI